METFVLGMVFVQGKLGLGGWAQFEHGAITAVQTVMVKSTGMELGVVSLELWLPELEENLENKG